MDSNLSSCFAVRQFSLRALPASGMVLKEGNPGPGNGRMRELPACELVGSEPLCLVCHETLEPGADVRLGNMNVILFGNSR